MISYNKFRVRWQIWKEVLNNFNVEKWKHKKYAWDEQNYIRQQLFASLRDSKDFHYAVDISDFESYSIISCVKKSKFLPLIKPHLKSTYILPMIRLL